MRTKNLPFRTIDMRLAASLLCTIPKAYLMGIEDESNPHSNKKIILIHCPEGSEEEFKNVERDFLLRTLSVNVFYYNQSLSQIRDLIRGRIENDGRRLQGIEIGNKK